MGAKQQLLGLADDRLPPTMTFDPKDGMKGSVAELKTRDAASPLAHTLPWGWGANFPPSIPEAKQVLKADSRFSASRQV